MGLAVEGGFVAVFLQDFREGLLVPVERVAVVHEAVLVAVLAAHDDGTARSADRVGAEAILEKHPLSGELVDVRRRIHRFQPTVVGADGMWRMVIAEDE